MDSSFRFINDKTAAQDRSASTSPESAALTAAIWKRDIDAARRILDQSFWQKTGFKPDGGHLFHAVLQSDRPIAKLLVAYGAKWTPEEARHVAAMAGERFDRLKVVLRDAQIPVDFEAKDLAKTETLALLRLERHMLDAAQKQKLPVEKESEDCYQRITRRFTDAILNEDWERAQALMPLRRTADPEKTTIDITDEAVLLLQERAAPEKLLCFLSRIEPHCLATPEMRLGDLGGFDIASQEKLILPIFDCLSDQEKQDLLEEVLITPFALATAAPEKLPAMLRIAKHLLLTNNVSKTVSETVMSLCQPGPHGMSENGLTAMRFLADAGFFERAPVPGKQIEALEKKMGQTVAPSLLRESLQQHFNRATTAQRFKKKGLKHFLHPKRFDTVLDALQMKILPADTATRDSVLGYLNKKVKDPHAEVMRQGLQALKEAGADFTTVDPHIYISKKGPGVAKALLDGDYIPPTAFNIKKIADGLNTGFIPSLQGSAAVLNFSVQVSLEQRYPERFKPLRGKETNYLRALQQEALRTRVEILVKKFQQLMAEPGNIPPTTPKQRPNYRPGNRKGGTYGSGPR